MGISENRWSMSNIQKLSALSRQMEQLASHFVDKERRPAEEAGNGAAIHASESDEEWNSILQGSL